MQLKGNRVKLIQELRQRKGKALLKDIKPSTKECRSIPFPCNKFFHVKNKFKFVKELITIRFSVIEFTTKNIIFDMKDIKIKCIKFHCQFTKKIFLL